MPPCIYCEDLTAACFKEKYKISQNVKFCYSHWKISIISYIYIYFLWKYMHFHSKITLFLITSFFLPVWRRVSQTIHMKSWWVADWGGGYRGTMIGGVPSYLLLVFSGSPRLSVALAGLCLLGVACNQLLFPSLWRQLEWTEECALSLLQHVRENHCRGLPRGTQTQTQPLPVITVSICDSYGAWFDIQYCVWAEYSWGF